MTQGSGTEITLAQLAKKIDEQAKFIRSLILVCTVLIIGVQFYTFIELFNILPPQMVGTYMQHLNEIVVEWNAIQRIETKKPASSLKLSPSK